MSPDSSTFLVEYERLRMVIQRSPLALAVAVLNASATVAVVAPANDRELAAVWLAAIVAVSAARWLGVRSFLRACRDGKVFRHPALLSVGGALATGALWGAGAIALFPDQPPRQLFLALLIGGMCAGAVSANGAHMPTVAAFIVPVTLPLAARLFAAGPDARMPALVVILFAAVLLLMSFTAHRAFGERARLRLALEREQHKLIQANVVMLEQVEHRRAAEATLLQAQKIQAIGHLTSGITHDFNNLLQVMIGNINLIQRLCGDNQRIIEYSLAAERAAQRGAELTSALLNFARQQSLQVEQVNINALLQEIEPVLLRTLGGMVWPKIALRDGLPLCQADPAHFQSAILNLVINARDAMPQGGTLTLTTDITTLTVPELLDNPDASPGRFNVVSISDTGSGVSPEVLARVFDPFFTTKETDKASGLGLTQVHGFARQSHGHVVLANKLPKGTEARLYLPVATPEVATPKVATPET